MWFAMRMCCCSIAFASGKSSPCNRNSFPEAEVCMSAACPRPPAARRRARSETGALMADQAKSRSGLDLILLVEVTHAKVVETAEAEVFSRRHRAHSENHPARTSEKAGLVHQLLLERLGVRRHTARWFSPRATGREARGRRGFTHAVRPRFKCFLVSDAFSTAAPFHSAGTMLVVCCMTARSSPYPEKVTYSSNGRLTRRVNKCNAS